MSVYLDASVILPILIEGEGSGAVDRYLIEAAEDLIVSDFAAAEVASALSRLVRIRLLEPEDAAARLADFDAWRAGSTADFEFRASAPSF